MVRISTCFAFAGRCSLLLLVMQCIEVKQVNAADTFVMSNELRDRCLKTLRDGLNSDEFWPSMHAAEGLTLAGHGDEVRQCLAPKLPLEKDDQHDRQFAGRLDKYYDEVIKHLASTESVFLFGPGEAKGELRKRMESKGHAGRIAATEAADRMTDPQVAAKVRTYFNR